MKKAASDLEVGDQITWTPALDGAAGVVDVVTRVGRVETVIGYRPRTGGVYKQETLTWAPDQFVWLA